MNREYLEQRDGGNWIAGTRVSLDSIVYLFQEGLSPETIASECLPVLSLEEVYGEITYYLAHRAEIDEYLQNADAEFHSLRQAAQKADVEFSKKLAKTPRHMVRL